jgi:hypothetical protein
MMLSIQDELKSQGIGSDGLGNGIFRVPCLAHVIQLSLNQLLGKIKAMPSNNEAEDGWPDDRERQARSQQSKREIIQTLNKVCDDSAERERE